MGKSTITVMVIFNSYVKLPEGSLIDLHGLDLEVADLRIWEMIVRTRSGFLDHRGTPSHHPCYVRIFHGFSMK